MIPNTLLSEWVVFLGIFILFFALSQDMIFFPDTCIATCLIKTGNNSCTVKFHDALGCGGCQEDEPLSLH